MTIPRRDLLDDLLPPAVTPRALGDGLHSLLPVDAAGAPYDTKAAVYDRLVRSRVYNRLLWGTSPAGYEAFARRAITEAAGPLLDAGCGSALFTAAEHARSRRPTVLVDYSTAMLRIARLRVAGRGFELPSDAVVFLQADLLSLPFYDQQFQTVLSMGLLHLFADGERFVERLYAQVRPGGSLYLSSLVSDRFVGRQYLALLRRTGEVAAARPFDAVHSLVAGVTGTDIAAQRHGNMAYFTVRRPPAG